MHDDHLKATEQHLPQSEAVPVIVLESDLKSLTFQLFFFAIKAAFKDCFKEEEELLGEGE